MKNLVSKSESLDKTSNVLVDYKSVDYRGFVFVVHHAHGMMLLRCTRKKNKPHHWQLPGGHIDKTEFVEAARANFVHNTQLLEAGKRGAARELFEETGIDVRSQLHRMEPATLREPKDGESELANEYKHRLFYILNVANDDFLSHGETPMGTLGETLKPEPEVAADMLKLHSGGKVSAALLMAMGRSIVHEKSTDRNKSAATTLSQHHDDLSLHTLFQYGLRFLFALPQCKFLKLLDTNASAELLNDLHRSSLKYDEDPSPGLFESPSIRVRTDVARKKLQKQSMQY
ncbi:predicted protein [Phaeodactylum tricornutum CCAP 1055/1]|uniref:Nudix hydrolase domain-containing protein n=2 Tax=Phaeodactylum tricornutum TaxID=2850 RepID=B7FPS7_PHATC|nr:predicted protein [Phaeodactylum tricornutum CCAP 1055/1]EEC51226.1 predicted protein [Phaeodactylum tricornutum CCAP 1055/1]|eukprot:XP_002176763.1 predicted protein [Phaeodactylum tricornutum CCAP 1055/1]